MLYTKTELKNAFFFKIKTSLRHETLADLPEQLKKSWIEKYHSRYEQPMIDYCKANNISRIQYVPGTSFDRDPIELTYEIFAKYQPEYTTITGVAFGLIDQKDTKSPLTASVDSIYDTDEKVVLDNFAKVLEKVSSMQLAGYNIANYQIPFLIKRMIVKGIKLPFLLQLKNKKPWDISMIDVMRDYQGNMFGDIDLALVAYQFGIITPMLNIEDELKNTMNVAIEMCTK